MAAAIIISTLSVGGAFALGASGQESVGSAVGGGLTISTNSGTLFGVANEYVYDQAVAANYTVSELNWRFNPIVYYGVDLAYSASKQFTLLLNAKSGISGLSGIMEDSDFLNGDGTKTLYSQSDNYTEQALLVRASMEYAIPVTTGFSINTLASVDYQNMKWSARDGYLQYPVASPSDTTYTIDSNGNLVTGTMPAWTSSVPQEPLYGLGVIYRQEFLIPSVGLALAYRPSSRLTVKAACAYSPIIIGRALDDHVLRLLSTTDLFTQGTYLEPQIDVDYAMSDRFGIRLTGSYKLITGLVGSSTWQYNGTTTTAPNNQYLAGPASGSTVKQGAGASYQALDINLSFRVSM